MIPSDRDAVVLWRQSLSPRRRPHTHRVAGRAISRRTPKPRLLDRVRAAFRLPHYRRRSEEADVAWIRRYLISHAARRLVEMGASQPTDLPSAEIQDTLALGETAVMADGIGRPDTLRQAGGDCSV